MYLYLCVWINLYNNIIGLNYFSNGPVPVQETWFYLSPSSSTTSHLIKLNKLSLCHELKFSNPYIFETQCRRPVIFQTMNFIRSKFGVRGKPSGFKDIGIIKSEFPARNYQCRLRWKRRFFPSSSKSSWREDNVCCGRKYRLDGRFS